MTISVLFTAPSGLPTIQSSTSVTSTSFVLNWAPPAYELQNGVIVLYDIHVTEVETLLEANFTSSTTSLTLQSLHPAYTYQCIVAANTVVGQGPFSTAFSVTVNEDGQLH